LTQAKIWLKWDQNSIVWNQNPYTWDQVFILAGVTTALGSGTGGFVVDRDRVWQDLERKLKERGFKEEECEKFLKIVIEVNGIEVSRSRTIDSIKKEITVEHIKRTLIDIIPSIKVIAEKFKKQ
jgi:hypothetical protein